MLKQIHGCYAQNIIKQGNCTKIRAATTSFKENGDAWQQLILYIPISYVDYVTEHTYFSIFITIMFCLALYRLSLNQSKIQFKVRYLRLSANKNAFECYALTCSIILQVVYQRRLCHYNKQFHLNRL